MTRYNINLPRPTLSVCIDKWTVFPAFANRLVTSTVSSTLVLSTAKISSPTFTLPLLAAGYPGITSIITFPSISIPKSSFLSRDSVAKNDDLISEKDGDGLNYCAPYLTFYV